MLVRMKRFTFSGTGSRVIYRSQLSVRSGRDQRAADRSSEPTSTQHRGHTPVIDAAGGLARCFRSLAPFKPASIRREGTVKAEFRRSREGASLRRRLTSLHRVGRYVVAIGFFDRAQFPRAAGLGVADRRRDVRARRTLVDGEHLSRIDEIGVADRVTVAFEDQRPFVGIAVHGHLRGDAPQMISTNDGVGNPGDRGCARRRRRRHGSGGRGRASLGLWSACWRRFLGRCGAGYSKQWNYDQGCDGAYWFRHDSRPPIFVRYLEISIAPEPACSPCLESSETNGSTLSAPMPRREYIIP